MEVVDGRGELRRKVAAENYKKVINFIKKNSPCTKGQIIKGTGLSHGTVRKYVLRLEAEQNERD